MSVKRCGMAWQLPVTSLHHSWLSASNWWHFGLHSWAAVMGGVGAGTVTYRAAMANARPHEQSAMNEVEPRIPQGHCAHVHVQGCAARVFIDCLLQDSPRCLGRPDAAAKAEGRLAMNQPRVLDRGEAVSYLYYKLQSVPVRQKSINQHNRSANDANNCPSCLCSTSWLRSMQSPQSGRPPRVCSWKPPGQENQ